MNRYKGYFTILFAMGIRGIMKTLYLNFKLLPFSDAVRLPMYCTAYTRFYSLEGKVTFECPVRHGIVRIGFQAQDMFVPSNNITLLQINGELRFGGQGDFAPGVSISVGKRGLLRIGKEFFVNSRSRIICHERIYLGDWVRLSWETQLYDTNFHYVLDLSTNNYLPKTNPVTIGDKVWIGNRTTIASGATLPGSCIVASNSLCTKDYSQILPDSIIGGIPAKLIKTGFRRLFSYEEEAQRTKNLGFEPD